MAERVALLEVEPDLARGIPADELAVARQIVTPRLLELPRGEWKPAGIPVGALVVDGLLTRDVLVGERSMAQLLGPGDLLLPWREDDVLVPSQARVRVAERATVAVLDERVWAAMRRFPSLALRLHERVAAQYDRMAAYAAILHLRRVEDRVLALFWLLADRFGRMGVDGVVVPLKLTHELLGRLAAAARPTVSLALTQLDEAGHVRRREDGAWVLSEDGRAVLAPNGDLAPLDVARLRPAEAAPVREDVPPPVEHAAALETVRRRLRTTVTQQREHHDRVRRLVEECVASAARSRELMAQAEEERRVSAERRAAAAERDGR